jgi:hypothetical protein
MQKQVKAQRENLCAFPGVSQNRKSILSNALVQQERAFRDGKIYPSLAVIELFSYFGWFLLFNFRRIGLWHGLAAHYGYPVEKLSQPDEIIKVELLLQGMDLVHPCSHNGGR